MKQIKILPEIKKLLDNMNNRVEELLDGDFVGLYVHGSIAMGCFNPGVSDVDFLVVIRNKLRVEEEKKLIKILLNESNNVPKGIEMSVVLLSQTKNPIFPTPFEFHFGKEYEDKYRRDETDLSKQNTDPDLVAHFTITKKRGITWSGLPINEVFSEIPKEMYAKSLLYDFNDLDKNIVSNTIYGILNACRTIAYLKDGLVLSKKEGGEWAMENFDKQYFDILEKALATYKTGENFLELDENVGISFVRYAKRLVEDNLDHSVQLKKPIRK